MWCTVRSSIAKQFLPKFDLPLFDTIVTFWKMWKCMYIPWYSNTHVLNMNLMELINHRIMFSKWSYRVVEMAPSCSWSDPQRTPETMEEKRKHRNKHDRECHAAETAEQKEHRLNKCRTKDRAKHAAHAAAEIVLHRYTPLNGCGHMRLLLRHQNRERWEECVYMAHAHGPRTPVT